MVNNKIIELIDAELASITNVPVISYENITYKPSLRTSYIRTTLLPAEPTQTTIGYDRTLRWNGLYQLDLFVPANTGAQSVIADAIITHFQTNRFLIDDTFTLTILGAWRNAARTNTDWYQIPLLLRYETFTQ